MAQNSLLGREHVKSQGLFLSILTNDSPVDDACHTSPYVRNVFLVGTHFEVQA